MKRLIALLCAAFILIGIRFYDKGIYRFAGGRLTVFDQTHASPRVFLPTGADTYRIDLPVDADIYKILEDCNGKIIFCEEIEGGRIIYAYSPLVARSEWVHGKRINVMAHIGQTKISVGVPVLKGSY